MVVIPFEWYVCVTTFDKTRQREYICGESFRQNTKDWLSWKHV